jgi:hypothetical protein
MSAGHDACRRDIGNSAREIREYFIPDFTNWKAHDAFEAAFARLLNELRKSAAVEKAKKGRRRK